MISTLTSVDEGVLEEVRLEMEMRQTSELFLLFTLGSQFDHLIKIALDKLGVFCLVADPSKIDASDVAELSPIGIILSGGPASVHVEVPPFDSAIFDIGIPVLGICLGFQLWAAHCGAAVTPAAQSEYGTHSLDIYAPPETPLFIDMVSGTPVLQSHGDVIVPTDEMEVLARTSNAPVAAANVAHLWGVQFHPEVTETKDGHQLFENFCFEICRARDSFPAENEAEKKVLAVREQVGNKKVLLALSGGSDSAVAAYILRAALSPRQVQAVYIRGIDRPDDEAYLQKYFGNVDWLDLRVVDATDAFLEVLAGKTAMHDKRVAMRGVYKDILEREASKFGASFIAQGTLYTDLTESGMGHSTGAHKAQIKLHHNTGLEFYLPELMPLDDCVKDTARQIGRALGAPEELLTRHPFPGPGLVVRIEGEITAAKLAIARQADAIYIEALREASLYETVWQAGVVVTQSVITCTKGDDASEGCVLAVWAVWSVNGLTAQWAELPTDFLRGLSLKLTNEIREVGTVVYRISDKPPTTIEWG